MKLTKNSSYDEDHQVKTIRQSSRTLRQKAAASGKHNFSLHILDPKLILLYIGMESCSKIVQRAGANAIGCQYLYRIMVQRSCLLYQN